VEEDRDEFVKLNLETLSFLQDSHFGGELGGWLWPKSHLTSSLQQRGCSNVLSH
jgi:hypothetical protein